MFLRLAANDTLLAYAINTSPSPLQVSLKTGNPTYGSLTVVVSNSTTNFIYCDSIQFAFPINDLAQGLASTGKDIAAAASPSDKWSLNITSRDGVLVAVATPKKPEFRPIGPEGLVFQIYNIPVNTQVGTATVSVDELASPNQQDPSTHRQLSFPVAKFPFGFFMDNFVADAPLVQNGKPVTLKWLASDQATYTIRYGDAPPVNVTNQRSWTSPPLTNDTTFILEAQVQEEGQTAHSYLTTTVIVANPDVVAASLNVQNQTTLQGPAVLASTLNVAGNVVGGGALQAVSLTANGATIHGDAYVSGVLRGESGIGGGAGMIQGYGTGGSGANFSFKYDFANFGHSPTAIQVWNASTGVFKTFIIDHPVHADKYLVHATLEGPEGGVYYRGSGRLCQGRAEIQLPAYFEALTALAGRTVLLTNVNGGDPLWVESANGQRVHDGRFVVVSARPDSVQEFDWEVKATRRDVQPLETEPARQELLVQRFGPYAYGLSAEALAQSVATN